MPKISLKNPREVAIIAEGGEKLSRILEEVVPEIKPGLTTLEIDSWIEDRIASAGGTPSFKMVPRYHWASCVGLNQEVVHSVPKKDKIVKEGDLLKIDMGMFWKGFHTDLAWTIEMQNAKCKMQNAKFLEAGKRALTEAIEVVKPGNRVGHISQKIQQTIEAAGYQPVKVLTGHGIGQKLHEEPLVPNVLQGKIPNTPLLEPGMTLAIEVIYNQGKGEVVLGADGWTISTKDGKLSALFEKTIAVTQDEPLVLAGVSF